MTRQHDYTMIIRLINARSHKMHEHSIIAGCNATFLCFYCRIRDGVQNSRIARRGSLRNHAIDRTEADGTQRSSFSQFGGISSSIAIQYVEIVRRRSSVHRLFCTSRRSPSYARSAFVGSSVIDLLVPFRSKFFSTSVLRSSCFVRPAFISSSVFLLRWFGALH